MQVPTAPAPNPFCLFELTTNRISYWNLDLQCVHASPAFLEWATVASMADLNHQIALGLQEACVCIPDMNRIAESHHSIVQKNASRYRVTQRPHYQHENIIGILMEVHEMSLTQMETEALKGEAFKWRTIVQNAPDALVIANDSGQIDYINTQAENLFGYEATELLGRPVETLMPENFRKSHPRKREGYTQNPHSRPMGNLLLTGLKKNGVEFPVDVSLSPMMTSQGLLVTTAFRDVTVQIQKEKQIEGYHADLAKQSQKLERILNSISECFCTTDSKWNLQYWNAAAVKTTRRNAADVLGKNIWTIFPQDESSLLLNRCTEVMNSRSSATFEHQNRYGKWYYNSVHPNEDGGITIYFKDITERKLKEIEVVEVRNNLTAVINATDDLIWSVDSNYGLVTSNNPFSNYNANSDDRHTTIGIIATTESVVDKTWKSLYDRCMEGHSFGVTVPQLNDYYVRFHPIFGASDAIVGAACHAVDTSQITQLEKAHKASSAKFEALVQNGSDLIFILDAEFIVSYVSPSVQELLGISVENSLSSIKSKVHPDDFHRLNQYIRCATASRTLKMEPFRIQSVTGDYLWIEATVDNLLNNEDVAGLVFNASDISAHKHKEQERELLINELTRSNSDLMQYSFITSHNLRAPLSNIQGLLEHLNRQNFDEECTEVLALVDDATQRLADTIADLSKILVIKNHTAIAVEPLDLEACFHSVNRNFLSAENHIDAEVMLQFQATHAVFNAAYLESIMINLISNAIKYRHPNRRLVMTIESRELNDGVMLTFADNGIGINLKRHKDRMFGMYQRFHLHTEGQGLGLFIVDAQVKALGGSISVESEEGVGSVFSLFMKQSNES